MSVKHPIVHQWWLDFLTRIDLQQGCWYSLSLLWLDFIRFHAPNQPISHKLWRKDLQHNLLPGCQFSQWGLDGLGSVQVVAPEELHRIFHALYPLR